MGSCEDSALVDEPSRDSDIEKDSCVEFREKLVSKSFGYSETGFDVIGANVNSIEAVDQCLGLSSDDETLCVSSVDVLEAGIDERVGLAPECENVVSVGLERVVDDECGVSGVCLNDSLNDVGVCNLPDRCLVLSCDENNVCASFANVTEIVVVKRDDLVSKCENMAGWVVEKMVDDVCGASLNESQIHVDVCCAESDGLHLENGGFQGEDGIVKSLEGCEMPLREMLGNTSGTNHDQQDVLEDEFKDDRTVGCLSGEERAIEEKNNALAVVEKDICGRVLTLWNPEPALVTGSLRNSVQKDDKSIDCPSLEEGVEVMEEKTDALARIQENTCDQVLPSQCCEMPTELMPLTDSLKNPVHQEDPQNDKKAGCPALEGVTEYMEEKINTCDQMLPSQGCALPSELTTRTGSLGNSVNQSEQKGDDTINEVIEAKNDSFTGTGKDICDHVLSLHDCEIHLESTEVTVSMKGVTIEKRDSSDGIETDYNQPESSSQYNELPTDLVYSTGVSNNSSQQNQLKQTECIRDPVVEAKADEIPLKSSCNDDSLRSGEGHNDRKDHDIFSHCDEETIEIATETKSNTNTSIIALPAHSYQGSLENLLLADSLSNCTQQNELSDDRITDCPSAERVPEVVEEKSDVTTGVKDEICTQGLPVDESLKEHSSGMVPNYFVDKLVSVQSCLPTGVDAIGSCNRVEVTDLFQKDPAIAIVSNSAVDCSGQTDHEGKDNTRVNCFSKTKYPDIISSYSRRSSRISKSNQKTQSKRVAKNSRNAAQVQIPNRSVDIIFKVARRKRSSFSKSARSSIWGLLGNITQIFSKSDVSRLCQIQNHGSQKAKGGKGNRKRNKVRASGSSLGSSKKDHVSSKCLRLKVKVGNEVCRSSLDVMVPEMVDTIASCDDIVGDHRTSEFPQFAHVVEDKSGEEGTDRQFQCFNKNPEETEKYSDDSVVDIHLANKELEGTEILDEAAADVADDLLGIPAHKGAEGLEGTTENNYVNPGTSPDSEVIDVIPEAQVGGKGQEGLDKTVLTSSTSFASTSSKRGKKKDNLLLADNSIQEGSLTVSASKKKAKQPKKRGGRQKKGDDIHSSETLSTFPGANASSNSSSTVEFCVEPLPSSEETELGIIEEAMIPSMKSKEYPLSKSSKSGGMRKGRSKVSSSAKSRRQNACTQGGNQRKSVHKSKVKEKGVLIKKGGKKVVCDQVEDKMEDQPNIGNHIADDVEKTESGNISVSDDVAKMGLVSAGVTEKCSPPEGAWVRCDECYKWRRIPVKLASSINNCRWVCKDNTDEIFADCSTPQEKSNEDINAELGLSDFEEDDGFLNDDGSMDCLSTAAIPDPTFWRINSNVFLHRSRKTQTIDEIMVCHCKPPLDGRLGCGDECLNRMLNIECVQGTCPCGDLCSNQQFQKRKYADMHWSRCGKKGHGLLLREDVTKGQFIIEYVGEVLDMQTYEARQKEYAALGHKHFYFMTLNGSEVIDACVKGNIGRFINHSCNPNCRTEKWMVNGEICIGLFALRDIKEEEELTFDYNYVRVFGAAAKKCYCGSPQCRGYIGGDPLNTEVIYQGDSDEEYPEPLMLEDGDDLESAISRTSSFYGDRTQYPLKNKDKMDDTTRAVQQSEISIEVENLSASAISQVHSSLEVQESKGNYPSAQPEISVQAEDVTRISVSTVCQEISMEEEIKNNASSFIQQVGTTSSTLLSEKLLLGGSDANRKDKSDIVDDKQGLPKSRPRIKTSRSSGSVKKGKVSSSHLNGNKVKMAANKSQLLSIKPKRIVEGSSNGRFEAVQEKLNELLDVEGGISKRKDAPKGYLKLLLLTAASGDSVNGEAIQSNRDLSMILDALLKTKSRVVLLDIINKNGLQMLHNMMKQYRRNFKKIPILRKLLKVLEYLAVREILSRDHIIGGPPCAGMESFRESILSFTEHDDKQVHQIARNFRDKWIPKPFRKSSYMDRDDDRMDFHRGVNCNRLSASHNQRHDQGSRPSEAIDCAMQSFTITSVDSTANKMGSAPCTGVRQTTGTTRKRKSRWDQPAEPDLDSRSVTHKEQKRESTLQQQCEKSSPFTIRSQLMPNHADKLSREDSNCPDCVHNYYNRDEAVSSEDGGQTTQEDVPPGFSSPFNPPPISSDASSTTDLPQQNVLHRKCLCDVAIGHPQQKFISRLPVSYGIPLHILQQFGSPQAETLDNWVIAPGMPFHPFPPLPPVPRDKRGPPPGCADSCKTVNESVEELQQDSHRLPTYPPEEDNPSTTGANQSEADIQQTCKRMRGSSIDLGRRYFRQQKRMGPPWLWRRNERSYCSQDSRVDKPSSNFYQRPSQQNHH
ncbi:histone-lysine N-methyltransferase ASHH2 [Pistacia vera]|uniref:histone-lysine N-methyltransferase ASHH2 n=1 Tax=Pistacia vera TaxID=55513 RepID=UPI00126350DD|nr:histone-lysine N-methyltransferase ASHH2 [Pistacia vera]